MDSESSRYEKLESMLHNGSSEPCNLPLEYLRNITNNFSDERLLGEGGFGKVYKGVLQNGETIAEKKLNSSIPGVTDRQFENEAYHLMRLRHPNVVLLTACCSETEITYVEYNGKYICAEKSERLLCLEYMPKGSLRGYLSDFGLSRLFSEEKTWTCTTSRDGTLGYMAPEYINRGLITTKSDIFSFGVIIIEIVTGHRDYPDETEISSQEFIELIINNWRNSLEKSQ
ncbi:cysteine-rich receptor-like protein kinase 40 isoform X2 [Setaria viridis]|uniref:cysteine-rich receptor-like protein kinase 40 isoform X2 n=1 Tax=Setaria viridis TaxID=4556 RepID=UPI003B3AEA44